MMESEQPTDDGMDGVSNVGVAGVLVPKGSAVVEKKLKILPVEKRTVSGASGKMDLCVITDEMAAIVRCKAGVVRLLKGVEGRNGGFGNAHIESHARRMKQFEAMGHRSVFQYCAFVGAGLEAISVQPDGRIVLIRRDASNSHQVICQWDEELEIWSVTTAIPMRRERDMNIMWGKTWN